MDDVVLFIKVIVGGALAFGGILWLVDWHRDRKATAQRKAKEREDMDAAKREHEWQKRREKFRRNKSRTAPVFKSTAPNARATVLAMRKEEQSASNSDAIADAMILSTMFMSSPHHADEPEPMRGQGGTFDGGGASGDWLPSSSSDSSSSCSSSSDSSSSSSSDSGSSCGGSD